MNKKTATSRKKSQFSLAAEHNDKIISLVLKQDELDWKNLIYDLIKTEQMDPWDIDISLLTKKFIEMLKKMKEMNFRISGKIVLASAILLKLKSDKLVEEDISMLDDIIASMNETEIDILEDIDKGFSPLLNNEEIKRELRKIRVVPKTPHPRKRKVSVYDLINALEKALEVKNRRPPVIKNRTSVKIPEKKTDVHSLIKNVFNKIKQFFEKNDDDLFFHNLLENETKENKILTFIPLLHLDFMRKINITQEVHFGKINIKLLNKTLEKNIEKADR